MIISLIGYMGCGKSHVSTILSQKLHYKLNDLDREISLQLQKTIPEIFKNDGEIFFRKKEREILNQLLQEKHNSILSVGGGTPVFYDNILKINERSTSFFLRASVGTLTERLLKNKLKRPLISRIKDDELPEFIAKHLFERSVFYDQALHTIITDHKTAEEIADEIILKIHGY